MSKSTITPCSNEADIAIFNTIPWCKDLLANPKYTIIPTNPRRFTHERDGTDILTTQTFATEDIIRACLVLQPTQCTTSIAKVSEILRLCYLGPKLSAIPNVAHGGVVTTLLDQFTGLLIRINVDALRVDDPDLERDVVYMTLRLDTTYRRAVTVPGPVIVRAWYDRFDGRKRLLKGRIEDGTGAVLAEADALYLKVDWKQAKDPVGKL